RRLYPHSSFSVYRRIPTSRTGASSSSAGPGVVAARRSSAGRVAGAAGRSSSAICPTELRSAADGEVVGGWAAATAVSAVRLTYKTVYRRVRFHIRTSPRIATEQRILAE